MIRSGSYAIGRWPLWARVLVLIPVMCAVVALCLLGLLTELCLGRSDAWRKTNWYFWTSVRTLCFGLPPPRADVWLSLPDSPEVEDEKLIAKLQHGDTWTSDLRQAVRLSRRKFVIRRRQRRADGGTCVETLSQRELEIAEQRGFEIRGEPELNRPD